MKDVLIVSSKFSEQDSVSSISKNIISSYKKIPGTKVAIADVEELSTSPLKARFTHLVIAHPTAIMSDQLGRFISDSKDNKFVIIFYIFGDYIRKSPFYLRLEKAMLGKKVIFIAASESYKELVKKTIIQKLSCQKLPFPLDASKFTYNKNRSDIFRKKYNLKKKDLVVLYTGRISEQKNLFLLIKLIKKLNKSSEFQNKIKLMIFGNMDEFETSTFYEKQIIPGKYFQTLNDLISNDKNIRMNPRTEHKELSSAYSGSNLFASLSIYHDEDFGYSPLEALCTGTPVLLTKWGGYKDLNELNNSSKMHCYFSTVSFKDDYLEIEESKLLITMKQALYVERIKSKDIKIIKAKYSLNTLAKSYGELLHQDALIFDGFSEEFVKFTLSLMTDEFSIDQYKHFYRSFWETE